MAKTKLTTFVVRGIGVFPWDMLRYDQAWPTDKGVEVLNHLTSPFRDRNEPMTQKEVQLQTHSENAPTAGRWASFGWSVIDSKTIKF